MSTFRPIHALLGALILSAPALAAPPSDAERAIEYRMAVMQVTGWNFGPMKGAVTGKVPYDKDAFALHAQRVATMAPMLPEGFPAGRWSAVFSAKVARLAGSACSAPQRSDRTMGRPEPRSRRRSPEGMSDPLASVPSQPIPGLGGRS